MGKNIRIIVLTITQSAQYFKTSAETSIQYLMKQHDFIEDHTALSDAIIESQILTKALKKGKVEKGIEAFPFRNLGTTFDYVEENPKYKNVVKEVLTLYMEENNGFDKAILDENPYWKRMYNTLQKL